MSPKVKTSKIDPLQALRAFAAIAVMFYHGTEMINAQLGYLFLNNAFKAGFSGVDVFFVLSGFIILYTSRNKGFGVGEFLKKRFIRIYPIYWVVTILLLLAYFAAPSADQVHKEDPLVIIGSFLLFPQEKYVLGVAWTLSYEIIFYLVFALTYLKSPKLLLYTFLGWISIILISTLFHIQTGIFAIDAFLNPVIINFAFGCLVAHLYTKYPDFQFWRLSLFAGAILFIVASVVYCQAVLQDPTAFTAPISRVYLFGIPATLLIFGSLYLKTVVPRVLVYLGDASYSLYLIHGTVLSILIKLVVKLHLNEVMNNLAGAILLFTLTVILSCLFYSLVEKRLLTILNQFFFKSQKTKASVV
ncbi:acyltransferase family protein [Xanthocytophaga flava]|uniref:acyltransferase family protein n=1 Tax=Xanthocytophaga flava TaxID=3048013 RepID=UPI0028D1AB72|nr:acyltransferase [Xanthocytophaga flavus]MDJ1468826.1 acyltransferase [Xanthocytophaga flavus]